MASLDHLGLPVRDYSASRDWYVRVLGLELELEATERRTAAVRDAGDLTIFLYEAAVPPEPSAFALWFQVEDVTATYQRLRQSGVVFQHEPKRVEWGYGAELRDPDGYRICLWDEKTMPKSSG